LLVKGKDDFFDGEFFRHTNYDNFTTFCQEREERGVGAVEGFQADPGKLEGVFDGAACRNLKFGCTAIGGQTHGNLALLRHLRRGATGEQGEDNEKENRFEVV
jgi:hypothetical protein